MTFAVRYTATARRQVDTAARYYTSIRPELGARFEAELRIVVHNLATHPEQYQMLNARYHRAFLDRFPFIVAYRVESATVVVIVGVLPMRGDPNTLGTLTRR